ncbi:putative structural protein [Aeromonas phage Gekk3-15]
MALQQSVRRSFGTGLVGEVLNDGPQRAKVARIVSTGTTAPNRVGRAFTYSAEKQEQTFAAIAQEVTVGGAGVFYGILGTPKHYALYGTNSPASGEQAGPLSPTLDLPQGAEAEFFDMAIMLLEVTNGNDTQGNVGFGAQVYYCIAAKAASSGFVATTASDLGKLAVFHTPTGIDVTQWAAVPNARSMLALPAMAAGASAQTKAQLTQ